MGRVLPSIPALLQSHRLSRIPTHIAASFELPQTLNSTHISRSPSSSVSLPPREIPDAKWPAEPSPSSSPFPPHPPSRSPATASTGSRTQTRFYAPGREHAAGRVGRVWVTGSATSPGMTKAHSSGDHAQRIRTTKTSARRYVYTVRSFP